MEKELVEVVEENGIVYRLAEEIVLREIVYV